MNRLISSANISHPQLCCGSGYDTGRTSMPLAVWKSETPVRPPKAATNSFKLSFSLNSFTKLIPNFSANISLIAWPQPGRAVTGRDLINSDKKLGSIVVCWFGLWRDPASLAAIFEQPMPPLVEKPVFFSIAFRSREAITEPLLRRSVQPHLRRRIFRWHPDIHNVSNMCPHASNIYPHA